MLETRTCGLGCSTTAAVFCFAASFSPRPTGHGTSHIGFFIGLVDPDPGFAKMAPKKFIVVKRWMGRLL